jgi:hypothetical protein
MAKFSWGAFAEEILALAPKAISDVLVDKQQFTDERKTQAINTAVMQASQLANTIDFDDSESYDAAKAVAGTIVAAVRQTPPQ